VSDHDESDPTAPAPSEATDEEVTSPVVRSAGDTTVITRTVARVVVPLIVVTSISLLIQGHNLPGGGFIGGVLTATAFALLFVVYGIDYVREQAFPLMAGNPDDGNGFVEVYQNTFGLGLGLAVASGLVPMLLGPLGDLLGLWALPTYPFLTQAVVFVEHVPLYGEVELASALAFDLGVYLVVVGGLLTILGRVGRE